MLHGRAAAVQVLYTLLLCRVTGTEGIHPGITIMRTKVQAGSSPQRSTAVLAQYPPGGSYPSQHLLGHGWGRSGRGIGPSLHVCSSSCRISSPSPSKGQIKMLWYMSFCTVERLLCQGGCLTSTVPPLLLVVRLSPSCG